MGSVDAPLLITTEYEKAKQERAPKRPPQPDSIVWLIEDMYKSTAKISLQWPPETVRLLDILAASTRRYFKQFNTSQASLESDVEDAARKLSLKEYEVVLVQEVLSKGDEGIGEGFFAVQLQKKRDELRVKPARTSDGSDISDDSGASVEDTFTKGAVEDVNVSREWLELQLQNIHRSLGPLADLRQVKFWMRMLRDKLSFQKFLEEGRETSLKRAVDWYKFLEDMLHTELYESYTKLLERRKQLNILGVLAFIENEVFPRISYDGEATTANFRSEIQISRKSKWQAVFKREEAKLWWCVLRKSAFVFENMSADELASLVDRYAVAAANIPVSAEEEPIFGRDAREIRTTGQDDDHMLLVLMHALCQLVPCQCCVLPWLADMAEEDIVTDEEFVTDEE